MIEGILESYWATESNGTSFKWDYARCSVFRSEQFFFSKISWVRTLQYLCCAYIFIIVFVCLIGVRWATTCCIILCLICCISEISYYGLGGWLGGWDKLRSYYGIIARKMKIVTPFATIWTHCYFLIKRSCLSSLIHGETSFTFLLYVLLK